MIIGFIPATSGSPFNGYEAYATNGQTIGTVDAAGTVRDSSGQVVGKTGADGIVISAAKPIGFVPEIVTSGLSGLKVYDVNGNSIAIIADGGNAIARGSQIGKVDSKSLVRDSLGKTVGFVPLTSTAPRASLIGRNVLDGDGASIGTVARDGSVRQGDRTVAGVEVSGVARDTAGIKAGVSATTAYTAAEAMRLVGRPVNGKADNYIGIVWEDGTVRDASGKVVGTGLSSGVVIDKKGDTMGVVSVLDDDANNLVDKVVYDLNGNPIGKVGSDGMVYDAVGKIIGRTNFDGSVVDLQGRRIGSVPKTNIIVAKNGTMKGKVEPRRAIFDNAGRIIGYVNDKGDVVDMAGNKIDAKVLADGTVVDSTGRSLGALRQADFLVDNQGNAIGFVGTDGTLYDIAGSAIGSVDRSGNIIDKNGNVLGSIQ